MTSPTSDHTAPLTKREVKGHSAFGDLLALGQRGSVSGGGIAHSVIPPRLNR